MKKLKMILLVLLTTLLICWIGQAENKIPREFSVLNISDIELALSYPAPSTKYVLYTVGNGWIVLNSFFFNEMHLKLAECDEKEKTVTPVINNIVEPSIAWYQEKDIVFLGVGGSFILGVILTLYLR